MTIISFPTARAARHDQPTTPDPLADLIELFLEHRRQANRAAETIRLYGQQLGLWHSWQAERDYSDVVTEITIEEFRAFFSYLREEYVPYQSPNSSRPPMIGHRLSESAVAAHWRTLRAWWHFLELEGKLLASQVNFFQRIEPPQVPEVPRPAADEVTRDALLVALGDGSTEESARNRAILLLLSESGMRISELCSLTDRQVTLRRRRAKVKAKGGKYRAVFWRPPTASALMHYLQLRRGAPYESTSEAPLFRGCSVRNNGGAVTPDTVRSLIKRVAAQAGIELPHGAPLHFFRHGFAHDAIDNGADISEVSQMLGHASITTTMRYVRESDDHLHDTYDDIFQGQKPGNRRINRRRK